MAPALLLASLNDIKAAFGVANAVGGAYRFSGLRVGEWIGVGRGGSVDARAGLTESFNFTS
jgi:hypothetical protein